MSALGGVDQLKTIAIEERPVWRLHWSAFSSQRDCVWQLIRFASRKWRSRLNRISHPDWVKLSVELNCVPNQNTKFFSSLHLYEHHLYDKYIYIYIKLISYIYMYTYQVYTLTNTHTHTHIYNTIYIYIYTSDIQYIQIYTNIDKKHSYTRYIDTYKYTHHIYIYTHKIYIYPRTSYIHIYHHHIVLQQTCCDHSGGQPKDSLFISYNTKV